MFETFIITFREGLEAFLVVAIMLAYLAKTGRENLKTPVYAGILTALAISATTGWHIADLAENPVWEGSLALVAGLMVASFTIYIMRTAKNIRQNIGQNLESSAVKGGTAAAIGVFIFTVLMISREGMETALMLGTLNAQSHAYELWAGAIGGLLAVAAIGYFWTLHGHRINLRAFLQVTGLFLVLFSVQLFVYGIHELGEMGAIPMIGPDANMVLHEFTEAFSHDSIWSQLITYSLLAVPLLWLVAVYLRDKLFVPATVSAAE